MIVNLSSKQLDATRTALEKHGLGWVNEHWLAEPGLLYKHTDTYECLMPAIGWLKTMDALVRLTVGPLGGDRRDVKASAHTARNRIAEVLSAYVAHPAFFGVGLHGTHYDAFPAWKLPRATKPGRLYDPFPVKNSLTFVNLIPFREGEFTIWESQAVLSLGVTGCSVLDLDEHLRFNGGAALPGAQASETGSSHRG